MHRTFFTFAAFVTGSMMKGCPGHLVHLVNSASKFRQLNAALQAQPFRPLQILTPFVRIHYLTDRRRLVRHQPSPPSCRRSRPQDRRSRPVSSPPDSVATRRFSSRPHHLFNVFLKVCHRKISQCSPNKDGGCRFEYTA